ncbi:MAG: hypothetical protein ACRC33_15865 [Gemmataceae bacterium]
MSDIIQFTTTVLPGGRIEVSAPELPEGTAIVVEVKQAEPVVVVVKAVAPPMPVYPGDEEAWELEDCGRIDLPPREVTPITLRIVDAGRQSMPMYAEEEE